MEVWPARRVEWLLAACLFGVGLVYAFGDELFAQDLYSVHSKILPRYVWAAGAIAIGMIRLTFLYVNGSWRRSPHWRALGAFLSCLAWFELTLAVLQAPLLGATVAVWPLFFAFDVFVALSAISEGARADVHHNCKVAAESAAEREGDAGGDGGSNGLHR